MKIVHENNLPYEPALKGDYENYVGISEMSITYVQNHYNKEDQKGDYQRLRIEARDGGGGFFLNLKTDSWSIDEPEDITEIVNDFKKRLNEKIGNL